MEIKKLDKLHEEKCEELDEYKGEILLLVAPVDSCHAYWIVHGSDIEFNPIKMDKSYLLKGGQI